MDRLHSAVAGLLLRSQGYRDVTVGRGRRDRRHKIQNVWDPFTMVPFCSAHFVTDITYE
jgi:hypothetical protein